MTLKGFVNDAQLNGFLNTDRFVKETLWPIIKKSFYYFDSEERFKVLKGVRIVSPLLQAEYDSHKETQTKRLFPGQRLKEVYLYYEANQNMVAEINEKGIRCGNALYCEIGNPQKGVCLARCADLLDEEPLHAGHKGTFIIFKVAIQLLKEIENDIFNMKLCPTLGCDGHISQFWPLFETLQMKQSTSHHRILFYSSQYYLYQYENNNTVNVVNCPRNILPYAVVDYEIIPPKTASENFEYRQPNQTKTYVVWEGSLTDSQECHECFVKLTSRESIIPFAFGKLATCSLFTMEDVYTTHFPKLKVLEKDFIRNSKNIKYFKMSSVTRGDRIFRSMMTRLRVERTAAVQKLYHCVTLIVFSSDRRCCQLEKIIPPFSSSSDMHCLIVFDEPYTPSCRLSSMISWRWSNCQRDASDRLIARRKEWDEFDSGIPAVIHTDELIVNFESLKPLRTVRNQLNSTNESCTPVNIAVEMPKEVSASETQLLDERPDQTQGNVNDFTLPVNHPDPEVQDEDMSPKTSPSIVLITCGSETPLLDERPDLTHGDVNDFTLPVNHLATPDPEDQNEDVLLNTSPSLVLITCGSETPLLDELPGPTNGCDNNVIFPINHLTTSSLVMEDEESETPNFNDQPTVSVNDVTLSEADDIVEIEINAQKTFNINESEEPATSVFRGLGCSMDASTSFENSSSVINEPLDLSVNSYHLQQPIVETDVHSEIDDVSTAFNLSTHESFNRLLACHSPEPDDTFKMIIFTLPAHPKRNSIVTEYYKDGKYNLIKKRKKKKNNNFLKPTEPKSPSPHLSTLRLYKTNNGSWMTTGDSENDATLVQPSGINSSSPNNTDSLIGPSTAPLKRRGRPKGSKNKKRCAITQTEGYLSVESSSKGSPYSTCSTELVKSPKTSSLQSLKTIAAETADVQRYPVTNSSVSLWELPIIESADVEDSVQRSPAVNQPSISKAVQCSSVVDSNVSSQQVHCSSAANAFALSLPVRHSPDVLSPVTAQRSSVVQTVSPLNDEEELSVVYQPESTKSLQLSSLVDSHAVETLEKHPSVIDVAVSAECMQYSSWNEQSAQRLSSDDRYLQASPMRCSPTVRSNQATEPVKRIDLNKCAERNIFAIDQIVSKEAVQRSPLRTLTEKFEVPNSVKDPFSPAPSQSQESVQSLAVPLISQPDVSQFPRESYMNQPINYCNQWNQNGRENIHPRMMFDSNYPRPFLPYPFPLAERPLMNGNAFQHSQYFYYPNMHSTCQYGVRDNYFNMPILAVTPPYQNDFNYLYYQQNFFQPNQQRPIENSGHLLSQQNDMEYNSSILTPSTPNQFSFQVEERVHSQNSTNVGFLNSNLPPMPPTAHPTVNLSPPTLTGLVDNYVQCDMELE